MLQTVSYEIELDLKMICRIWTSLSHCRLVTYTPLSDRKGTQLAALINHRCLSHTWMA